MSEKKVEIIRKEILNECYRCKGTGEVDNKPCITCEGRGVFVESFYYHCVNGICFSGDTLK